MIRSLEGKLGMMLIGALKNHYIFLEKEKATHTHTCRALRRPNSP
jgi:hypothetical protein